MTKQNIFMDYLKKLKQNDEFEYWQGADNEQILYIEKKLNIKLPNQYKTFLSQCGMCNFGDVNIFGIANGKNKTTYSVVEMTKQMREKANLSKDFIVLSFEDGEYLILLKVSENQELEDSPVYGVEVEEYDASEKMKIGKLEKLFSSFKAYFEDFIELAD